MSETNLILILNKVLQKARKKSDTYFFWIKYVLLRVTFIFFTKKTNVKLLISWLSNILI